jgi:N4-gp56 family major capsid protein
MRISKLLAVMLGVVGAWASPGLVNASAAFQADIPNYIQKKVLPLSQRYLVAYQFGQALTLPKGHGVTYTASRYTRLTLPLSPLTEGVSPPGEALVLQQVTGTAQQWGDTVKITDVAEMTIFHPLFQQAIKLLAQQQPETYERNTFNSLLAGTNVNYANGKANRAALVATDTMTIAEVNKIQAAFYVYGVPEFMGDEREDIMKDAQKVEKARSSMPHYVALMNPFALNDMRQSSTVLNAWSYSDVDRIYNRELGDLNGVRFCISNMVPYWVGNAAINGVGQNVGGNLVTGNYFVQVTASPSQTNVEQQIYQASAQVAVVGPNASIQVTLPVLANYVFSVYIGTTAAPANLGLSASGPVTGPLAGNAVTLAGNQTVTITGIGTAQVPPAAPATGVTVVPTFWLGRDAYGQVLLDNVKYTYLSEADKSDPLNQIRVAGWKGMYGTIILNQAFFARTEAGTAFTGSYTSGAPTLS